MKYITGYEVDNLWYLSREARSVLEYSQIELLKDVFENVNYLFEVEKCLNDAIFWSSPNRITRLMKWLSALHNARPYMSQSYSLLICAVLWAFKEMKPIINQTQHQFNVSISALKEVLAIDVPLIDKEDARYLLMNIFILSERPDLLKTSFRKEIINVKNNLPNRGYENPFRYLISNLFVNRSVPSFLFEYINNISIEEYRFIIDLLDGKSIRKTVPYNLKISKSENAILQNNLLKLPKVNNHFLNRFLIAARILKEKPEEHDVLNLILESSKIFKDEFLTFLEDEQFWKSVFRFAYRNKNNFGNRANLEHFIDFFEHERYYDETPLIYSLKGRTFNSVARELENWNYNYNYNPQYLKYKWESLPFEKWTTEDEFSSYCIEEITTGKRLLKESKTLNHCVFSYAHSCNSGAIHIFSLSIIKEDKSKPFITIEVRDLKITQIAAVNNHAPSEKMQNIIETWAAEKGLVFE